MTGRIASLLLSVLVATLVAAQPAAPQAAGWTVVDYASLVDGRRMTHAGEPVGRLLELLDGRPLPPPGQRSGDRALHAALDPLVEPYAFVLSDVLDSVEAPSERPWFEVARLWEPGERQPAWAELLRARRFVVESDGAGTLRVALPWEPAGDPRRVEASVAAGHAWTAAWPVLRHVFAAERRRLAGAGEAPALNVRAYAYVHSPERSLFLLGLESHDVTVDDTRSTGDRPPLDLAALQSFIDSGWTLEGGKLDIDGRLIPLASRRDEPASLLGRRLDMTDLAVAFRAASYGGNAEPYMSLDPGYSPWQSLVNYGARLRDTSLGMVSLLCDVRFKTFSTGLGILEGRDMRDTMRAEAPAFRTHMERFAADPSSGGVMAQQTRLWFYPDGVDLTVSAQGDVLAMRRVRMTAASERVVDQTLTPVGGPDPPWTRRTLASINEDYDALANAFAEMRDLDQVVRMLSFFTWLDQAAAAGARVPDLEVLLAYELPELRTPREFPQLLAYEALPAHGTAGVVESFDRVPVADALERLNPRNGDLDPDARYGRALAGLDRQSAEEAAFLDGLEQIDVTSISDREKDMMAYRAQRLRMHRTVLRSLEADKRAAIDSRPVRPRVFSVAVGGLDLGMGKVLDRARGRSIGLLGAGAAIPREATEARAPEPVSPETRARWREDPAGLPRTVLPDHGSPRAALHAEIRGGWVERIPGVSSADGNRDEAAEEWVVYSADSPEYTVRRKWTDGNGTPLRFERHEQGRRLRYSLNRRPGRFEALLETSTAIARAPALAEPFDVPDGLAMLEIDPGAVLDPMAPSIRLRLRGSGGGRPLEAAVPRWVVQRLVLGREADMARDPSLPGIAPFPAALGQVTTLMVLGRDETRSRPWDTETAPVAGEQDPMNVAAAIQAWWDAPDAPPVPAGAVVGCDPARSPARWSAAPRPGPRGLLVLPLDGFSSQSELRERLAASWGGRVSERAEPTAAENLVVVVSAEPPGRFANRLRAIAASPVMRGKLLAGWSLGGPVRDDIAAWILEDSQVAGVGLAGGSVVGRRSAPDRLAAVAAELASRGKTDRVESIPGPFLWVF